MRPFNAKYVNGDWETGQAAAGTTAATATTLTADNSWIATVTASANGVILKAGDPGQIKRVFNADSADDLYVYPPSGANFNGKTADFPIMLPAGRGAMCFFFSPTKIGASF